ncbi:histidine kinase sensor domain-containing protein [Shewanella sp. JM162201]|uniref:histidine kinase n=1 Tax=Shewanella jiangmenensis TaxID=2837387 RepID=A0ABS5V6A9_9GAMM|nr:ATP-binding protein [Shewanella jiangmenensis]MBT1445986.1 histidine kinase sensor domain-containing protein [Shewanella jiangmenensis]
MKLPHHPAFARLQWRLFGYFGCSLLVILLLASLIESLVLQQLLMLPKETRHQLQQLAQQAESLVKAGDKAALARWEAAQPFSLHVIDARLEGVSGRPIHPHFVFKLQFLLGPEQALGDRVQKPLIGLPIYASFDDSGPLLLAVQLNAELHPARDLHYSLWAIRVSVGLVLLWLFSRLLGHYLIRPLSTLQQGTRALAGGNLNCRIGEQFSTAEPEFYQLARDFDDMASVIQRTLETQQRLIRDISHELRTPLARQKLACELLMADLTPEPSNNATNKRMLAETKPSKSKLEESKPGTNTPSHCAPYLRRIFDENQGLSQLIDTLLSYSRLASGYQQPKPSRFDLHTLMQTLLHNGHFEATKGQQIHWLGIKSATLGPVSAPEQAPEPACEPPLMLETDSTLLHRALENLIRNSLKYAAPPTGEPCRIEISAESHDDWLRILVSDNGPGISRDKLETLFHPFTRFDEARHQSQGGYGLGLAIVRECMRVIGGEASATQSPQGGLQVCLMLPRRFKALGA